MATNRLSSWPPGILLQTIYAPQLVLDTGHEHAWQCALFLGFGQFTLNALQQNAMAHGQYDAEFVQQADNAFNSFGAQVRQRSTLIQRHTRTPERRLQHLQQPIGPCFDESLRASLAQPADAGMEQRNTEVLGVLR